MRYLFYHLVLGPCLGYTVEYHCCLLTHLCVCLLTHFCVCLRRSAEPSCSACFISWITPGQHSHLVVLALSHGSHPSLHYFFFIFVYCDIIYNSDVTSWSSMVLLLCYNRFMCCHAILTVRTPGYIFLQYSMA